MGQDWSWPCASRKLQEKRLKESKYDYKFFEHIDNLEEMDNEIKREARMNNLEKIEEIVQSYNNEPIRAKPLPALERKYSGNHQLQSVDSQSGFSFTEDSISPDDLNVLVLCEDIEDFDEFVEQSMNKYKEVVIVIRK